MSLHLREWIIQLRDLDRALAAQRARIASAGSAAHALERLERTRTLRAGLQAKLDALASEIRSHELDSKSLDDRLKALHQRIYGGQEPPFILMSLEAEQERLRQQRDGLDEELLGELDRQERFQKERTELDTLVGEQEADLAQARVDDREQDERLRSRLAQLETQRTALCTGLDAEVLADYERLLKASGEATAQMRRAACTACRMGLSDVIFRKFRLGELVRCPNCERFLLEFQP